ISIHGHRQTFPPPRWRMFVRNHAQCKRRFAPICPLSLVLVIALGCATEVSSVYAQDLALGAGFKAGFMCSAVFQGGRRPLDVTREELQGVGWRLEQLPEPVVDYVHRAVFVAYPGGTVPRMAIYRDGLGTLLTPPGWTLADVDKVPHIVMPLPAGAPAHIPWPAGDLVADVSWPAQVSRARLEAALDAAFTPGPTDRFTTIGVVVVYKDQIIAERYAPGWGVHVPYRTWSTGKRMVSALIGILVRQGKL